MRGLIRGSVTGVRSLRRLPASAPRLGAPAPSCLGTSSANSGCADGSSRSVRAARSSPRPAPGPGSAPARARLDRCGRAAAPGSARRAAAPAPGRVGRASGSGPASAPGSARASGAGVGSRRGLRGRLDGGVGAADGFGWTVRVDRRRGGRLDRGRLLDVRRDGGRRGRVAAAGVEPSTGAGPGRERARPAAASAASAARSRLGARPRSVGSADSARPRRGLALLLAAAAEQGREFEVRLAAALLGFLGHVCE